MEQTDGIYAAHPSYGNGNKASHKVFWSQSVKPDSPYAPWPSVFEDHGSSLLADSFNFHWKTALNMQLLGRPISRFVMLHDDIVPEGGWMGKLLAILDETGADLVSVVVPIKDARGISSTALDDPDDPWAVYRRLTMAEVGKLPETFTARDCARAGLSGDYITGEKEPQLLPDRALLVNTGCWACRFDRPWRHQVSGFNIPSRLAFKLNAAYDGREDDRVIHSQCQKDHIIPADQYRPGMKGYFLNQVMSEDWDFSRQLARLGCDVRATRKIACVHMGDAPYNNQDCGWGVWDRDEALSAKYDPDPLADVDGWLLPIEGRFLASLAEGKNVLEIGSWCGKSTIWMAKVARHVLACDTFDGRGTPEPRKTYEDFKANLHKYGLTHKVTPYQMKSEELFNQQDVPLKGHYDLVYIDGAHDRQSVETDVAVALHYLLPGGVIAFDDYTIPGQVNPNPDVAAVINDLIGVGWEVVGKCLRLVALKPKISPTASSPLTTINCREESKNGSTSEAGTAAGHVPPAITSLTDAEPSFSG